ncbi:MAG: hypothetical protein AAGH99_05275 [Planctomycetota bacterium]
MSATTKLTNLFLKIVTLIAITLVFVVFPAAGQDLPIPPQDRGLAYTRSAHTAATEAMKDYIALHALSRYAYVYGYKTRIDNEDILRGEPLLRDGRLYIPTDFTAILTVDPASPPAPAPFGLDARWVYDWELPAAQIPSGVRTTQVNARTYVDLIDLAEARGMSSFQFDRMWFVAPTGTPAPDFDSALRDTVVAQFDTPEKYADPELPPRYIPQLKRQGVWTDHVEASPEDFAALEGPEPQWPVTPRSAYNLDGFNEALLGSEVPAPGVYPRLLFSEADLPAIRERIESQDIARQTFTTIDTLLKISWLDPATDDGRLFAKLAAGDTDDLTWDPWKGGRRIPLFPGRFEGYRPGIYSSHIAYASQCLTAIALHAMVTDDSALGEKAGRAIANLYRLQEPHLDTFLSFSDTELGANPGDANASTTQWRGVHTAVAHMDLPFALDFAGKYMSETDLQFMQQLIARLTYGRRTNGGDGPRRNWRDINHVTWHTTHLLALMTIEGLEGFDPEAYASGAELIADFVEWGVNKHGILYESNGKAGGGLQFQVLNMIALARRGDNLWGHPHWRKVPEAQVLNTAPNGATTVSSGTWSGGEMAMPSVMMFHAFYPENRYAHHILTTIFSRTGHTAVQGYHPLHSDLDAYRQQLAASPGRTRLPGVSYPGFTLTLLYDTDSPVTSRADLGQAPLDYVDEDQGILSSYSHNGADAAWMHLLVRHNHYLGSGHHHADAGMFHFASGGINWITESPFQKTFDGRFHNQVLIDGLAQPDGVQGRADWLQSEANPEAAFATADLTQAYTWRWSNQFIYFDTDDWGERPDQYEWSVANDPVTVKAFRGTQRYKMRPWWATSNFSNWFPVLQRPYNPVEYAFRTAGMVRGPHTYGVVIDDVKKDEKTRLYQWSAMPGPGVWAARTPETLPLNSIVLAHDGTGQRFHAGARKLRPRKGDPLLMITVLGGEGVPHEFETGPSKRSRFALNAYDALAAQEPGPVNVPLRIETRGDGPHWKNTDQAQFFYDQIIGGCHSTEAHFKTLLIPCVAGEPLPEVTFDAETQTATVSWSSQTDTLRFIRGEDGRTGVTVERAGEALVIIE